MLERFVKPGFLRYDIKLCAAGEVSSAAFVAMPMSTYCGGESPTAFSSCGIDWASIAFSSVKPSPADTSEHAAETEVQV